MDKPDCFLNIMSSDNLNNPVIEEFLFKILDEIEQNI